MTLRGDQLTEALVPLAADLVTAVHGLNADVVHDIITHPDALAGDPLTAARLLAVLCAGMASEDHGPTASLGWTRSPERYRTLRKTCDAFTASLRAGKEALEQRAPRTDPIGA